MKAVRLLLTVFLLLSGAHVDAYAEQATVQERVQVPDPSDPTYRATVQGLRKRIEAMPENTVAQKEDKLALRKYLETRILELQFQHISVLDEPEYQVQLATLKKDIDQMPENTSARKRDKREIQKEFELRRVDVELWRLSQGK